MTVYWINHVTNTCRPSKNLGILLCEQRRFSLPINCFREKQAAMSDSSDDDDLPDLESVDSSEVR